MFEIEIKQMISFHIPSIDCTIVFLVILFCSFIYYSMNSIEAQWTLLCSFIQNWWLVTFCFFRSGSEHGSGRNINNLNSLTSGGIWKKRIYYRGRLQFSMNLFSFFLSLQVTLTSPSVNIMDNTVGMSQDFLLWPYLYRSCRLCLTSLHLGQNGLGLVGLNLVLPFHSCKRQIRHIFKMWCMALGWW